MYSIIQTEVFFAEVSRLIMVLSKKFVLAKKFVGKPSSDNIKLVTEELPDEVNDDGNFNNYYFFFSSFHFFLSSTLII